MNKLSFATGALCLSLMAGSAQGAVLFSFIETGGDVVGTLSGTINLQGAQPDGSATPISGIFPQVALVSIGGNVDRYFASFGPASNFGTGADTLGIGTGDAFGVGGFIAPLSPIFAVPDGYDSGTLLSGTLTFSDESFATLGINPGSYVYTLPNDTVTISFTPAVVPLPATLPLLLGALGLAYAATRRRA